MTTALHSGKAEWPLPEAIPAERVLSGKPEAQTLVIRADDRSEVGLWRCTPGEFRTSRDGYSEFIHIIAGEGQLIGDDGTTTALEPGVIISLEDGWSGRWVITETVSKSYAVVYSERQ